MELKDFYYDNNDIRLHGLEGPAAGPPLVLLHGATGSAVEWMPIIPHLAERWHVFALDLRGHGLSGWPADRAGYHMSNNVADTLAFLRGRAEQPAVLVGHSYGAVTALLAGMPGKDYIRALVLEDPPAMLRLPEAPVGRKKEGGSFNDYFTRVYQIIRSVHTVDEILDRVAEMAPQAPREALRPWAQNLAWLDPNFPLAITVGDRRETVRGIDFTAHARGIACPVLLMQADPEKGAALLPEDAYFLLAMIPDVRLAAFPGVGHGIHSDQPEAFLQTLDGFLDDLP